MRLDFIGATLLLDPCCGYVAMPARGLAMASRPQVLASCLGNQSPSDSNQAAAEKLVCRPPQIQAEAAMVELTEPLHDELAAGVEVVRRLLEGE
jgi:hypothetical protein